MMASITISPEPNQSSSSPRSSITCIAASPKLSVPNPNQSSFVVTFRAVSGKKVVNPKNASKPTGTLI